MTTSTVPTEHDAEKASRKVRQVEWEWDRRALDFDFHAPASV